MFTLRGIGYLLGSFLAGESEKFLDGHKSLALSALVMCFSSVASIYQDSLFLFTLSFFFMGMGMGSIDVLGNT